MSLSPKALLEISELTTQAFQLAKGGASERAQADVLKLRITSIHKTQFSTDEMRGQYSKALVDELSPKPSDGKYLRAFLKYVRDGAAGNAESELRTIQAGSQSITYTQGAAGGFAIPMETLPTVWTASAQTDPVVSPAVTDFVMEDSVTLHPKVLSGYDLSTVTATLIGEATQQTATAFPAVSGGKVLRGNLIYKWSVEATLEAETDISELLSKIAVASGVAIARATGRDAILGSGVGEPLGLLTSLPTPSYTTGSGKITLTDLTTIYFNVNRFWRAQPLCSWLMSDSVYQRVRAAVDTSGRPLLNVVDDQERLLGKPLYVSPSMGVVGGSPAADSTLAFGDFSNLHLRCSRPTLQRSINSTVSDITQGKALFIGRMRFDSAYLDPSGGTFAPITTAEVLA